MAPRSAASSLMSTGRVKSSTSVTTRLSRATSSSRLAAASATSSDGLRGCEAIRKAGGQILVQDEASSVVWGMPGAVATAGLAHALFPIADVASAIARAASSRSSWGAVTA